MSGGVLWHYTCDHGRAGIDATEGFVVPARYQTDKVAGGPGEYAWFTDLATPARDALGLTSQILHCDRTAHRYRVTDATDVVPWTEVRRQWLWAEELESAPGARPRHWFVATVAVPADYAPILTT